MIDRCNVITTGFYCICVTTKSKEKGSGNPWETIFPIIPTPHECSTNALQIGGQ